MNFSIHRQKRPSLRRKRGFALVVTLSLMILLTIIAVVLLSLSAVSLRSSSQGMAQAEAQANARLALMLAIGELQKELGPDQRISAQAGILDNSPDDMIVNGVVNPHYLGVWESWDAWLTDKKGSLSIQDTYKRGRDSSLFRKWLVSHPDARKYETAISAEPAADMNHFKDTSKLKLADFKSESPGKRVKQTHSILFHADANDPDMLYFSRFNALDPYLALTVGGKKIGVAPIHEYGRMAKESAFDELLLLSDAREGAAKRFNLPQGKVPETAQLVLHLAEIYGIPNFRVGSRFPVGLARKLREAGMTLEIADEGSGLFPERQIKTAAEVESLRKGNHASEAGFRIVTKTLAESKIRNGILVHGGSVLTAERLRELISHAALDAGAMALHTIAAPGDQAVDNHCAGHGPSRAGELIVVDIFPRRIEDGYWGDMTRTYLKGKASDAQRRLVRTVKKAHKLSIEMIKPGVTGGKVHDAVQSFFDKEGYETVRDSKEPKGFFHALGHGVGLEIQEFAFCGRPLKEPLGRTGGWEMGVGPAG